MKRPPLRIAIVGCGTAGPAAAVLLKRQGHEVVLFERADECKAVGAGFLLQPSGMVVLEELGILDEVLAHAAKVDRLHVLDIEGDTLLDLHYQEIGQGSYGAGLHRPVLLHHLIECMRAAGVEVRWGWEIEHASKSVGRWTLRSSDGGECSGFDLLVVADGARSKLRDLAGTGGINRGYPWGAHWFIGRNDGVFPENELYQVVNGTRRLGGFLAPAATSTVATRWSACSEASASKMMRNSANARWKSGNRRSSPSARAPVPSSTKSPLGTRSSPPATAMSACAAGMVTASSSSATPPTP